MDPQEFLRFFGRNNLDPRNGKKMADEIFTDFAVLPTVTRETMTKKIKPQIHAFSLFVSILLLTQIR